MKTTASDLHNTQPEQSPDTTSNTQPPQEENLAEEICQPLLEKYTLEHELGKGGGGRVYLARDELGRQVALKHRKATTPDGQRHVERLLEEAKTVANLRHPNVAIVYTTESYPELGDYCVVMEYANGGTLTDLIGTEDRLSLERALDIGIEVCTALEYVHRQGLIHGDIKPSNILLFLTDGHMEVKIADFGLSQSVQVGDYQPEGQEGGFTGTLEYAAPELLGGESVDDRIDLYSLGAAIYDMLVGKPPFPFSGDVAAVIAGHLHGDLTPPQDLRLAVFNELNDLVVTALAKSPSERFQDAEKMLAALQKARELYMRHYRRAEDLYNQGTQFEDQEKWSEAVKSFEEAYNLNPELRDIEQRLRNAQLQLQLETTWRDMETLMTAGEWADALEQLGRIGTLAPEYQAEEVIEKTGHAKLQLKLASLYGDARAAEGAGRRREAIGLYVKIVGLDDRYPDAAQRLARLRKEEDLESLWADGEGLVRGENWEEAVEIYTQILEKQPDYPGAAKQLDHTRRQIELSNLYAQALELENRDWDRATEILKEITTHDPGYKDAAVRLADASRQQHLKLLRQSAKRAIEGHKWSEARVALEELCRFEPENGEDQQQLEYVRQCQEFDRMYQRGKADYDAQHWDEAIAKLERSLKIADTTGLDLHNYGDIRLLLDQARTNKKLDAIHKKAKQHEAAEDFNPLIQTLGLMLELAPGNQEVLEWKESTLKQMQLKNLHDQASSRMKQGDWSGAKRLLDEIASVDAEYKDAPQMRAQVAVGQRVSFARRRGFPLAIALGVTVLLLLVPRLVTEPRPQMGLGGLAVTPEFVGTVISVFALLVSIIGLLIPTEKLYELLKKNKRMRTFVALAALLSTVCLLMLIVMAFVPAEASEGVRNGDFERGFKYWQHGGELDQSIGRDGDQHYAVLGNSDYPCYGGVPVGEAWTKQTLKVPRIMSPTLSLRYRVFSYDLNLPGFDYFLVAVNGKLLHQYGNYEWVAPRCDEEPWDSGWQPLTIDLSSYRGEEVELSFHSVNGTQPYYNTWTHVDDVRIDRAYR